ncbi:MAG: hypothetical protein ACPG5V_15040, partial [Vibrio cyclitrophicus]
IEVTPETIKSGDGIGCWSLSLFWGKTLYSKRSIINRKTTLSIGYFSWLFLVMQSCSPPITTKHFVIRFTLNDKVQHIIPFMYSQAKKNAAKAAFISFRTFDTIQSK